MTEKWLVRLQARCRGYLVRKQIGDRLEYFHTKMGAIIKIQVSLIITCHYKNLLYATSNAVKIYKAYILNVYCRPNT